MSLVGQTRGNSSSLFLLVFWDAQSKFYLYYVHRYELIEAEDGNYGVSNDQGEWNGLVGMLQRRVSGTTSHGLNNE